MSGGIIAGIIVGIAIAAVVVWIVRRQSSKFKSVITEFMEAGKAKNVEAAYACCSPHSFTKERIAELIGSSSDLFAGYERLTIRASHSESEVGITGSTGEASASGAIIYTGGKRLPFTAQLVKEDGVWKITGIQIGSTAKWWRYKKKLAIVIGSVVVVGILIGTIVPSLGRFFSGVEPVIAEFMEAGVARNVEAAYTCWSPQSVTEEEITELIESSYDDVFAGYERLNINIWNGQSSGGTTTCYVSGAVIYTGDQSLPLEASLAKESEVWKIVGIQIGSTVKGIVTRPPPSDDDWDEEW